MNLYQFNKVVLLKVISIIDPAFCEKQTYMMDGLSRGELKPSQQQLYLIKKWLTKQILKMKDMGLTDD